MSNAGNELFYERKSVYGIDGKLFTNNKMGLFTNNKIENRKIIFGNLDI